MELEDMVMLARRSRECAKRAHEEEAFWEKLIAKRLERDGDGTSGQDRAVA